MDELDELEAQLKTKLLEKQAIERTVIIAEFNDIVDKAVNLLELLNSKAFARQIVPIPDDLNRIKYISQSIVAQSRPDANLTAIQGQAYLDGMS